MADDAGQSVTKVAQEFPNVRFVLIDSIAKGNNVNSVLFRAQGLLVATVDSSGHAHLHRITQGRDFGKEIEVLSGVEESDTLIVNPPDSISDGMQVRVASPGKS